MAKKFQEREMDMRVRTLTRSDKETENSQIVQYRLVARDKEGLNEVVIKSSSPFKGLSAKTGTIQIVLRNSQTTVKDFEAEKESEDKDE